MNTAYPLHGKSKDELTLLCHTIKELMQQGHCASCEAIINEAMQAYPQAAELHNLLGLLLEGKATIQMR